MLKTIEAVKEKFTAIRAGRANVSMLDGVRVENYGSEVPLNQIGAVSAPEARLLVIDPWDKSLISKIEKALLAANLGMTPNNDGRVIRLVLPELTAERRKEYVKLAKNEAENSIPMTRHCALSRIPDSRMERPMSRDPSAMVNCSMFISSASSSRRFRSA